MSAQVVVLLLAQVTAPTAPPAGDVTVLAQKLATWRGRMRSKSGSVRCETQHSTGDAPLDEIGCASLLVCVPQFEPRLIAAADRKRATDRRKQMNEAVEREILACFTAEHDRRIAAFAEQRYQARQEGSVR
jgi:hypothetical protein